MSFTGNPGGFLSGKGIKQTLGTWVASNLSAALTNSVTTGIYLGGWDAVPIPFDCLIVGFAFSMKGSSTTTGTMTLTPWINGADPGAAYDAVFTNQANGANNESFYVPCGTPLAAVAGTATVPGDTFQMAITTTADWDATTADFAWSPVIIAV